MADPVSWFLIEAGWKVLAADGTEVGAVNEVAGDEDRDIFNGLSVATSALGKPRYVPAEWVAEITEGVIRLSLGRDEVARLDEYLEPPTASQVVPDPAGGAGRLDGDALGQRHARPLSFRRRIALFFRRRSG